MSLLLTKTCEYAILVTIQQGRSFAKNATVKVETELDLKLPPSINDLIPQNTIISTPATKSDASGNCTFNQSLVYYVSWKQLQRLRKLDATTTLHVHENKQRFSLTFSISEAKEVVHQSGHKLDQIYKFVSDKGAWCSIQNATENQQLKAGLFYVQMPDSNNAVSVTTPSIQLRSPPPTPSIPKRVNTMASNRRKKVLSILGSSSHGNKLPDKKTSDKKSAAAAAAASTAAPTVAAAAPPLPEKPPLRRAKSSLVDLNIQELSSVLQKMSIFSAPPTPPLPPEHASYHQIGQGSSQYTFYFKVMYVDHIQLQQQQQQQQQQQASKKLYNKKPFIAYTFLTNYTLLPAASFSSSKANYYTTKSSYQLRGHLVDIQHWLDGHGAICLDYMWMDKFTKETVGQVKVPLEGIAFDGRGMSDKVCHVVSNTTHDIMASVTVRTGLVSGWHKDDYFTTQQQEAEAEAAAAELASKRTSSASNWDTMMLMKNSNKKSRHHSQSSIPTLSTTTCSTKSSNVPSIHLIHHPSRPTSLISTKSKSFSIRRGQ